MLSTILSSPGNLDQLDQNVCFWSHCCVKTLGCIRFPTDCLIHFVVTQTLPQLRRTGAVFVWLSLHGHIEGLDAVSTKEQWSPVDSLVAAGHHCFLDLCSYLSPQTSQKMWSKQSVQSPTFSFTGRLSQWNNRSFRKGRAYTRTQQEWSHSERYVNVNLFNPDSSSSSKSLCVPLKPGWRRCL